MISVCFSCSFLDAEISHLKKVFLIFKGRLYIFVNAVIDFNGNIEFPKGKVKIQCI